MTDPAPIVQFPTDASDALWAALCEGTRGGEPQPEVWASRQCPAHEDRSPSLSFKRDAEGVICLKCHAGCSSEEVVEALGGEVGTVRVAGLQPWPRSGAAPGGMRMRRPEEKKEAPPPSTPCETDPKALFHPEFGVPEARFDVRDVNGDLHASVCRWDRDGKKEIRQWRDGWGLQGTDRSTLPLFGSELLPRLDPSADVLVYAEGEKAAVACRDAGVPAVAFGGCSTQPQDYILDTIRDFDVIVWADADAPGRAYAQEVATRLKTANADRKVWIFDPFAPAETGDDAHEFFQGCSAADFRQAVANLPEFELGDEPLPELEVHADDRDALIDEIDEALADTGFVYLLNGIPTKVGWEQTREANGRVSVRRTLSPLKAGAIPALVSSVRWVLKTKIVGGEPIRVGCSIPAQIATEYLDRAHHPALPVMAGVLTAPTLLADGRVLNPAGMTPGQKSLYFDAPSGYLFNPKYDYLDVPESPTRDEALAALARLKDPFCDFRVGSAAGMSTMVGAGMTIVARPAIVGPVPMLTITASTPGEGKGLLADAICLLATGERPATKAWALSEEEREKALLADVLAGKRVVLYDNVRGKVESQAIEMAVTSSRIEGRLLGKSQTVTADWSGVFVFTGNGLTFGTDISRRSLFVRLDAKVENPFERTGPEDGKAWKHPKLREHCRNVHPLWVSDALLVLRAYIAAGRPSQGLKPTGSFDEWGDLIRNALVWLGEEDPYASNADLRDGEDTEKEEHADQLAELQALWGTGVRFTATDVQATCQTENGKDLRAAFGLPYDADTRTIGLRLRQLRGRVIDGVRLESGRSGSGRWWTLEEV